MSHRFIPTKPTKRQTNLRWMNMLHHVHDLFCDCPNSITHTATFIFEQEPKHVFLPPEKDIIKQCLSGEQDTAAGGDPGIDAFTGEELENLFKDDAGEDADTR